MEGKALGNFLFFFGGQFCDVAKVAIIYETLFNLVQLIEKDVDLEEEFQKYLSKMKLWVCELLTKKLIHFHWFFLILKVFFF
jgi:hypothetical protein